MSLESCDCNGSNISGVIQCHSCGSQPLDPSWVAATQRLIQNQVRIPSSQYSSDLASMNVRGTFVGAVNNTPKSQYYNVNWNQGSDRAVPSVCVRNVPSHGNSTKRTLTAHRPGAFAAADSGVDVKHNSYNRRLMRLKGNVIRERVKIINGSAVEKAYYTQYSSVQNSKCNC